MAHRRPVSSLRETRFADSAAQLSEVQLQRLGISEAAYRARAADTEVARVAYEAALASGKLSDEQKHDLAANFAAQHGKAAFKCPGCWLLPGCCVCARLRHASPAPHAVALYGAS
jgi:hypothetical protein